MNILEKIVSDKRKEVAQSKDAVSIKRLEQTELFTRTPVSLSKNLKKGGKSGVIAEIKRSSPSTSTLNTNVNIEQISKGYVKAGATALSILTDEKYFAGTVEDLKLARSFNACPILRKDFIIDEYQVLESKSIGADCILLIAACLTPNEVSQLAALAKSLQLEVLLEVHSALEAETHFNEHVDVLGVNNRNLKSFETDITMSIDLFQYLPQEICKISESGITTGQDLFKLKSCGYDGFLIGGHFMKTSSPANACKELIDDYKSMSDEG